MTDLAEPRWDRMTYQIALFIEQDGMDPLRLVQVVQIVAELGGAAGLVCVNRLSQKPGLRCLRG